MPSPPEWSGWYRRIRSIWMPSGAARVHEHVDGGVVAVGGVLLDLVASRAEARSPNEMPHEFDIVVCHRYPHVLLLTLESIASVSESRKTKGWSIAGFQPVASWMKPPL